MKKFVRDLIKPTISLFVICIIVTGSLAYTYSATKSVIEGRAKEDAEKARTFVLASADSFVEIKNLDEVKKRNPELQIIKEVYSGRSGGQLTGYVYSVVSKGYGGDVKLIIGIEKSGKISGVKITESNETPGLGTKAADTPFLSQLNGMTPKARLSVVKVKKKSPEEIEAISGATITSKAVVKAVQAAVTMSVALGKKEVDAK